MGISILVSVLATALSAPCATDKLGYCTDKIVRHEIGYSGEQSRVRINTALGDVVSLSFPKGVRLKGEPALGNKAIFAFRAQEGGDTFRILLWPKIPENAKNITAEMLKGERSNLQVFLDSGVTVSVDMKIDAAEQSVEQVIFEFPEREKESEYLKEALSEQARRLEAEYQERVSALEASIEERARRRLARAILDRKQCEELSERSMRDLLVVRAHEICRFGDLLFVKFGIQNRARDLFHLDRVEVDVASEGVEESTAPVEAVFEFLGGTTLAYDEQVLGMAVFAVEGEQAKSYRVRVKEDGGKKRVVSVDDVEF